MEVNGLEEKKANYLIQFFPCLKYPGNRPSKQVFLSYSSVRPNGVIPAADTLWWYKCHLPSSSGVLCGVGRLGGG